MRFSKAQLQAASQKAVTKHKIYAASGRTVSAVLMCVSSCLLGILCQHYFGLFEKIAAYLGR